MKEIWRLNALERYASRYAEIWNGVARGLRQKGDAFWLIGASSYVFSTGNTRWAVDPMFNTPRSGVSLGQIDAGAVFDTLSFALLTHSHADHFDPRLMAMYPRAGWIVPDHMAALVPDSCRDSVLIIHPGERIERGGAVIEAFSSLHYDAGTDIGVPETGYLVDTGKQRLLFPGDIRDYDASRLPAYRDATHLFAHVWLGRGNALNYPCGDYPEQFARFMSSFGARTIYLTHLMEAERPLEDLWTYAHAGLAADALLGEDPALNVVVPLPGIRNGLSKKRDANNRAIDRDRRGL